MDVSDTKPLEKCCSKCGQIKLEDKFIPNRNICKECRNLKCRENYKVIENACDLQIKCNCCNIEKSNSLFYKSRKICKECLNEKRRNHYKDDDEHRLKLIQMASSFKHNKVLERQQKILEEIGEGNKKCSWCNIIKESTRFRYNRLKCRDCERDDPLEKFKRIVRSRIWCALKNKNKHTVEYLGCNSNDYLNWLSNYNKNYNLENRGKEWHIDHVIPLSKFDLDDQQQQLIAFNWRNTMPLSPKENLSKNSKILIPQIEQHYKKLLDYHKEKEIELPQEFIDLFAKYLVAGNPLEPLLPLTCGNVCEEHD
jgi:hypothetical protein